MDWPNPIEAKDIRLVLLASCHGNCRSFSASNFFHLTNFVWNMARHSFTIASDRFGDWHQTSTQTPTPLADLERPDLQRYHAYFTKMSSPEET